MRPQTKAKHLNTIYTILALSGMVLFLVTIIHPNWFSLISCGILIITALIAFFMAQAEIRKVEELNENK
jgi:Flp pilus assembly protein TadB